jgi:hypothetical protein
VQRRGLVDPTDELVGLARHGRNHDGDFVAGIDLAFDVARRLPDAIDIGDRRAAKLHDDACHGKSPRMPHCLVLRLF